MAFCNFSKDNDGGYTVLENRFITKYLPEADGFAVKVYLYGLYLCARNESDFSLSSMAEALRASEDQIKQAFAVWEDYDLVQILSQTPFTVQYLPLSSSEGKPKKVNYGQYTEFNKELQRKMQKVGKFVSSNDYVKYMRFLEDTEMRPQALLLIVEYCIAKDGTKVAPYHIFNKAKKLLNRGCFTYEQVERALSCYNENEKAILEVLNAMANYKDTLDDGDYGYYEKWTEKLGFAQKSILAVAKAHKGKSFAYIDVLFDKLAEKGKREVKEIEQFLVERPILTSLARRIANKLGVKIANLAPYVDEYVEKWYNYGFEDSSLTNLALYCMKTERGSFEALDELLGTLFKEGAVSPDEVGAFVKERTAELKLFTKLQELCGGLRKNAATLSMIGTWRSWNFKDEMILEAATRAANSTSPLPYMNKVLSEWKQSGVFEIKDIPVLNNSTGAGMSSSQKNTAYRGSYTTPSVEAANAKADRERYYSVLREKAQSKADKVVKKANGNPRFKEISKELSKMEISLAKAEMFEPEKLPKLKEVQLALAEERKALLFDMGIAEEQLLPQYACPKCKDTGFLPDGTACDCYTKELS